MAVGVLLLLGTVVAVALALSGIAPRALQLVGMFWAIYGFIVGLTSGVLEPAIEGVARALSDLGLIRGGGGFSSIETLVVRGDFATAAEAYRERAQQPSQRVEATLRRAGLLGGPLRQPETALVEVESLRQGKLSPARTCEWESRWWISTSAAWLIRAARWRSSVASSISTPAPRPYAASAARLPT